MQSQRSPFTSAEAVGAAHFPPSNILKQPDRERIGTKGVLAKSERQVNSRTLPKL
jgi:hypothetical protein